MALVFYSRGTAASVAPGGVCTHGLAYTPDVVLCTPFSAGGSVGVVTVLSSFADSTNVYVSFGAAASNGAVFAQCLHSWIK